MLLVVVIFSYFFFVITFIDDSKSSSSLQFYTIAFNFLHDLIELSFVNIGYFYALIWEFSLWLYITLNYYTDCGKFYIMVVIYLNVRLFKNYSVNLSIWSKGDILYEPSTIKVAEPNDLTGNFNP